MADFANSNGSLLNMVKNLITPNIISKVSNTLGEKPQTLNTALNASIPAVLASIVKMGSTESGARNLLSMIQRGGFDLPQSEENLVQLINRTNPTQVSPERQEILGSIFGSQGDTVIQTIAQMAGMRNITVHSILGLLAPMALSVLGKHTAGFIPTQLMSFLGKQKESIMAALPRSLDFLMDQNRYTETTTSRPTSHTATVRHTTEKRPNWVIPAAIAALLALGGWLLTRHPRTEEVSTPTAGTTSSTTTSPNSIEEFTRILRSDTGHGQKRVVFREVNFDFGTANITPSSSGTVATLASTLNANPSVSIRLEGHTDNVGDKEANRQLSISRAQAVKDILVARGVDGSRIEIAGFGDEKPIASNNTEEGRSKNRRIEIVVLPTQGAGATH